MVEQIFPQCRIVPIQMLKTENAEKFLDGLSCIAGIRRMLVHGPGYLPQNTMDTCIPCSNPIPIASPVIIADQTVNMHLLMGDVIIETVDNQVIEKIADYCMDFFDDIGFQILVGKFIKPAASLSDFAKWGMMLEKDLVGLSDYKQTINPYILKTDMAESCNT